MILSPCAVGTVDNGLAQYHMYQVLSTGNHVRSLVTLTHTLNTYMGEVKVDLTNNLPGPVVGSLSVLHSVVYQTSKS